MQCLSASPTFGVYCKRNVLERKGIIPKYCQECKKSQSMCGHVRRVPYIVSLLRKGLAVPESRIRIGGGNEGWTLGAALAEGGRVGVGRPLIDKVMISLHGNIRTQGHAPALQKWS